MWPFTKQEVLKPSSDNINPVIDKLDRLIAAAPVVDIELLFNRIELGYYDHKSFGAIMLAEDLHAWSQKQVATDFRAQLVKHQKEKLS